MAGTPDRAFSIGEERYRLCVRDGVRMKDLEDCSLTLVRERDGAEIVMAAAEFQGPRAARSRMPESEPKIPLRELIETLLTLEFDEQWFANIGQFVRDHRLLETPELRGLPA